MTEAEMYAFLSPQRLGVLATLNAEGIPQSVVMGIAITPKLELVFDTVKSSRKYPNLIGHPDCSFAIGGWDGSEQCVQYEGVAEELKSPELERYLEIYFKAFPDGPARMKWPGIVYFVVRPRWIRYSNFNEGQRQVAELTFAGPEKTS